MPKRHRNEVDDTVVNANNGESAVRDAIEKHDHETIPHDTETPQELTTVLDTEDESETDGDTYENTPVKKSRKKDLASKDLAKKVRKGVIIAALSIVSLGIMLVIVINIIGISVFAVNGSSMEPNFHDGDTVVLDQVDGVVHGQLVFFSKPKSWDDYAGDGYTLMKRIAARPGDTLSYDGTSFMIDGEVIYDGTEDKYECAAGEVGYEHQLTNKELFVMGDNANHSLDSRRIFCDGNAENMFVGYRDIIDNGVVKAVF